MNPPVPSSERTADLRRRLLSHYDRSRRDLPWRGETDPYRILVSEVMLQQTRVETVKEYYGAWLERFPDAASLARADPGEVLKAWEGLGYYRRARNLHAAARLVRDRFDGAVPEHYEELKALPGVGEYTAGAVASIGFDERVPAVDGNVRRVLSRIFDVPDPKPAWLRGIAGSLVDANRPGDWNQALMELGATICKPTAPLCEECPIAAHCTARAAGSVSDRPIKRGRSSVREVTFVLAVLRRRLRVMLVKRPSRGLLADMWAFPEIEIGDGGAQAALGILVGRLGVVGLGESQEHPPVQHRFSHLLATYLPFCLDVEGASPGEPHSWIDPAFPTALAIPVAQQRVLESARIGLPDR